MWTYFELGQDLGGAADATRRERLQTLMPRLGWPAGCVGFWPVAAYEGGELVPDGGLFWRGASALEAEYVICFGSRALEVIRPGAVAQLWSRVPAQRPIVLLPELGELGGLGSESFGLALRTLAGLGLAAPLEDQF